MDYKKCIEMLNRYLIARIPFIVFRTVERSRAAEVLKAVSGEMSHPIHIHSQSKGMCDLASGKQISNDKDLMGALDFIVEQVRVKQNLTFALTEVSDLSDDSAIARYFLDVIALAEENMGTIIVLTSGQVWNQLQRTGMTIELDLPNESEMLDIIRDGIEPYKQDISVEWTEDNYREAATILMGASRLEAQNVIASLVATRRIGQTELTELKFAKDKLVSNINGLEKVEISPNSLSIGGLKGLGDWLEDKRKLLAPSKQDIMARRGMQPPRGILLVGVPGCGKSMSAKAVAALWNMPLYRLDFATVQGQYVGQSEQRLKEAFSTAEHVAPCVLWVDEIEKGLAGSGSDSSGVTTRMVGQFLFWLQECKKHVFVVATANDVSMLPSELLRRGRFDELFFIDLPNAGERADILKLYLRKYLDASLPEKTLSELVSITDGFTGADLESSIRDIAYRLIANENLVFDEKMLLDSVGNVIPLSKTSPEKIEAIRAWGRERAVPASGQPIGGSVSENKAQRRVMV